MPGMDGLELVRVLRAKCPQLPVILMTGHGSEKIAAEALRQGAASYVAKCRLAEDLVPTVENVLGRVRTDRREERLQDSLVYCESGYVLDNDSALIGALVEQVQRSLVRFGFCDSTAALQIGSALEAALSNALYHGNLELGGGLAPGDRAAFLKDRASTPPYCDRRIHVCTRIASDEAQFVIRDDGKGFDHAARTAALHSDQVGEEGRGLTLMHTFMDRVRFNDAGNEVSLLRRRAVVGGAAKAPLSLAKG
jgi:hypothetical protein